MIVSDCSAAMQRVPSARKCFLISTITRFASAGSRYPSMVPSRNRCGSTNCTVTAAEDTEASATRTEPSNQRTSCDLMEMPRPTGSIVNKRKAHS